MAPRRQVTSGLDEVYATPLTTLLHLLLFGALVLRLLGARLLDRRPVGDYGLHLSRGWWLDLGAGAALASLLRAGIFAVELAMGWIKVTDTVVAAAATRATTGGGAVQATAGEQPFALAILAGLVGVAAGALVEELTFRGYLIKNLAEGLRSRIIGPPCAVVLAILVSSVLFAQGHAGNPNATAFSVGNTIIAALLVLSAGYALTGQLALPLGFHTAWNFVQVCVLGFSGGASVLGGSFIGLSDKGPGLWTGGASGPEGAINQPTPVPNVIGALSDPDVVWHQPGRRLFAGNDQTGNDQSS